MVLLCGCPTVDLGDDPPDIGLCNPTQGMQYYVDEIVPKYLKVADTANGCGRSSACHNRAHGLALDLLNPNSSQNYRLTLNYLNCGQPRQSQLLTKPLAGEDGHGGGDLFQNGSTEMMTFLMWFQ
jgi:hypothetical protein